MLESRLGPDGWDGELANEYRSVRLKDIHSVWYRHPSHFIFPGMSSAERRHAAAEGKCGLGGTLSRLSALWVNYPSREADAVKPAQLDVARACGLWVPETLVTNKPDAVRAFAKEIGGPLAVKNLSAAAIAEAGGVRWRSRAGSNPPIWMTSAAWKRPHTCFRNSSSRRRSKPA